MSHLAEKAKALAEGTKTLAAETEREIDSSLIKLAAEKTRKDAAMQKIAAVHEDMSAGSSALEEVVKNLTNE